MDKRTKKEIEIKESLFEAIDSILTDSKYTAVFTEDVSMTKKEVECYLEKIKRIHANLELTKYELKNKNYEN